MELRLLESFVVLSEELHFGRAAGRLGVGQSQLSQRIQALEREVGAPLLERTTRRVDLTPAGRAFLEHAQRVLLETDAAVQAARLADAGRSGRLVVGFSGTLTYALLPLVVLEYGHAHPDVDLELRGELLSHELDHALHSGDVDVAFLRLPVRETGLRVEVVWREPLVAALPSGHPLAGREAIAVAELQESPFVAFPGRRGAALYGAMMRCCEQAGFRPRVVREVRETYSLVCYVAAGYGVSLVPASVAHLHTTGIVYRPLTGPAQQVPAAMAARADAANPLVEAFTTRMRDVLGRSNDRLTRVAPPPPQLSG